MSTKYSTPSTQCPPPSAQPLVTNPQCLTPTSHRPSPNTQCLPPSAHRPVPTPRLTPSSTHLPAPSAQRLTPSSTYAHSWAFFFKLNDQVIALPCWRKPRLYILSRDWKQRWNDSTFYPAFKPHAKLFKLAVRILATCGLLSWKKNCNELNVERQIPKTSFDRPAVLVGTQGPAQKLIVRYLDKNGKAGAYIKYGEKALAKQKIKKEAEILNQLSRARSTINRQPSIALAPQLLWHGEFADGIALMISAVEGKLLPAKLSKKKGVWRLSIGGNWIKGFAEIYDFLKTLELHKKTYSINEHPAILRIRKQLTKIRFQSSVLSLNDFEKILVPLRGRDWPVVIQHGDFAPWNILRLSPKAHRPLPTAHCPPPSTHRPPPNAYPLNSLCAIDWEEGTIEGFPYFDLIYYILQTAFLIHKWSPEQTSEYVGKALGDRRWALGGRYWAVGSGQWALGAHFNKDSERIGDDKDDLASDIFFNTKGLNSNVIHSLIKLTALDAYLRFSKKEKNDIYLVRQFFLQIVQLSFFPTGHTEI